MFRIQWQFLLKSFIENEDELLSFMIWVSRTLLLTDILLSSFMMRQTTRYPVMTPLGSDGDAQDRLNSVDETTVRITSPGTPGPAKETQKAILTSTYKKRQCSTKLSAYSCTSNLVEKSNTTCYYTNDDCTFIINIRNTNYYFTTVMFRMIWLARMFRICLLKSCTHTWLLGSFQSMLNASFSGTTIYSVHCYIVFWVRF